MPPSSASAPVKLAYTLHQTYKNKAATERPLLLIPGLFGSRQNWQSIGKALSNSLSRPVIALDSRNHGDSPHTSSHTYHDMCSDVQEFVQDRGFDRVDLVGHSMGGKVAMLLALQNPTWLKRAVIVDMSPVNQTKATSLFKGYVDSMQKAGIPATDKKSVDEYLKANGIPEMAIRQFLLTNLRKGDDGTFDWRVNLATIGQYLDHLWTFPVQSPLAKYDGDDILFVKGSRSNYITESMWPAIQTYFPQARLAIIQNAGHWVHSENPKEFIKVVESFIGQD